MIVPLLIDGLEERKRCLYLGEPGVIRLVKAALAARGVDVEYAMNRGALVFSSDRSYLAGGFDPRAMVDMLTGLIDQAVHDGFVGLCASGDMTWELGDEGNFEKVLEYEALLERVFRERPLSGICQYRRDIVPTYALQSALLSHRSVFLGGSLAHDNVFYVPPDVLLGGEDTKDQYGEWMYQQIKRVTLAERSRDQAIAALRESEAAQRRLLNQLADANHDLERRVDERTRALVSINEELEAFSYSVSHDLRAPLRRVAGFAQILKDTCAASLDQQGVACLDRIDASVRLMGELIQGMLALSRVAKASMNRKAVELSGYADEALRRLREEQPERRVECEIQKGLWTRGDPVLLRVVVDNLIDNAWKFTAPQPQARIGFLAVESKHADTSVFCVSDNGVGFDMTSAERLFGPFQRFHSEHQFPGTGVGLATVQRIVSRHGGRVWAQARPGGGAAFYFSLPRLP